MRNRAYDLSNYAFTKEDVLLLDANVWLYLHPAPSGRVSPAVAPYSVAFGSMLAARARIMMDAIILSEYLNRYCRIEWAAQYARRYPKFKAFRNSTDFLNVGSTAATLARLMLKKCELQDHPFASADLKTILSNFENGTCDLNDGLIAHTCRKNGWKLVTNDSDLVDGGIEVLTVNRTLLRACP